MLAKEIMHSNILTAGPGTGVQDLVKIMLEYNVSMIPIINDAKKVLGVVTEGDIIYRAYADVEDVDVGVALLGKLKELMKKIDKQKGGTAKEIMSEELYTATPDTTLAKLAKMMVEKKVKNIPILQDGVLVGLVSRRDIMRLVQQGKI